MVLAERPCPTCYTSTSWAPVGCAGAACPLHSPCTVTVYTTTSTIPGVNPACPVTPTVTATPSNCPPNPQCWTNCEIINLATYDPAAQELTVTVTEAPVTCMPSTVPTSSGTFQTHWGQCGGISWTGPTACASSYTCSRLNEYYSQCVWRLNRLAPENRAKRRHHCLPYYFFSLFVILCRFV